jgi:FkbM family methyltransferase
MKIYTKLQNLFFALRYRWVGNELFFVILKMTNDTLHLRFYSDEKYKIDVNKCFNKRWLTSENGQQFYNFNGAKMPLLIDRKSVSALKQVFDDVFIISCRFGDNYSRSIVEYVDLHTVEGCYGYSDDAFDVTVRGGDVVIDAGAWYGDFSAYAANKGATAYAFEPAKQNFNILEQTKLLNLPNKIIPINKGLSDKNYSAEMFVNESLSHSTTLNDGAGLTETVELTTLDQFVAENNLAKVDFIKADIEGEERKMLLGARETLRKFAPKLAICTYHLPDDREVLTKIILDANPNYSIKYLRHKLFAAVV